MLLTYEVGQDPTSAVLDNQAIAESRTVAEMAMAKLGVHQTVGSFVAATTVSVVTQRILQITVSAPTSAEAVSRANAVATSFLTVHNSQIETDQNLVIDTLQSTLNQAQAAVAAINSKISKVSAEVPTPRAGPAAEEPQGAARPGAGPARHRPEHGAAEQGQHR